MSSVKKQIKSHSIDTNFSYFLLTNSPTRVQPIT